MTIFPMVLAFFALVTPFNHTSEPLDVDRALEIERTNYISLMEQWFGPTSPNPHNDYRQAGRACGLEAENLQDIASCLDRYYALYIELNEGEPMEEPEVPPVEEDPELGEETTEPEILETPTEPETTEAPPVEEEPEVEERPVVVEPRPQRPRPRPRPSNPTSPTSTYTEPEVETTEPYRSQGDGYTYTSQPQEDVFFLRQGLLIRESDGESFYYRFLNSENVKTFEEDTYYTILYRTAELGSSDMMVVNRILQEEPIPEEEPETTEALVETHEAPKTTEPIMTEIPNNTPTNLIGRILLGIGLGVIVVVSLVVMSIRKSRKKALENEEAESI